MTIHQAIQALDTLQPNPYGNREKLRWLCALEARIYDECRMQNAECRIGAATKKRGHSAFSQLHFDGWELPKKPPVFDGWETRDLGEPLLLPAAHEEVYLLWLMCQVDFMNGDWGRYNNSAARFNTAFAEMARSLNRRRGDTGVRARNY